MNKKNALLVTAAVAGLFAVGLTANVQAGSGKAGIKKECKNNGGEWKNGECSMEEAVDKAMEKAKCADGKCGEGKCGEGKCGADKMKKKGEKAVDDATDAGKAAVDKAKDAGKKATGSCGEGSCGEGSCGGK